MNTAFQFFRKQLRLLFGSVALVVVLAIFGSLAVVAVRFIPDERVLKNAGQSVETLVREGDWPLSMCSRQDNFMDAMYLNIASHERVEPALESALMNYFSVTETSEGVGALAARFPQGTCAGVTMKRAKYDRYWFGTVALVRPLLAILDYPQGRILNTCLVFAILVGLLCCLYAAGLLRYGFPLVIAFVLMDPPAIGKSIQFGPCFYLSMVPAILLLALRKTHLVGRSAFLPLFFAGIGALTSYFDLLTYPILTFCLPMAFYLLLRLDGAAGCRTYVGEASCLPNDGLKERLYAVAVCLAHWSLGFLLMWLLKWVLVTALTDVNAFREVFQKVAERSGSAAADGLHISRLHAVRVNFLDFLPCLNAWLVGGFVLAFIALYRGGRGLFLKWLPAFCVAALPPVWMFLTANHVYIHHFFTCKSLAATLFVFLCWVTDALSCGRGVPAASEMENSP